MLFRHVENVPPPFRMPAGGHVFNVPREEHS